MEMIEHTIRLRRRKSGAWHVDEESLAGLDIEQLTALGAEIGAIAVKRYSERNRNAADPGREVPVIPKGLPPERHGGDKLVITDKE